MRPSAPPPRFQPTTPFVPARGLGGPHAQTLAGHLLRPARRPVLVRERWETPDGDFLDVDLLRGAANAPWLLVLHGLEGSSRSGYVAALLRGAQERGWGAAALNFRSCSGEPNRLLRSYNSGDTSDALFALEQVRARTTGPLFAAGFSLGGNVLVRMLAGLGEASPLTAAAAVSVPYDLFACARALDARDGWMWLYRVNFLRSLREKALEKARRFPEGLDVATVKAAKGIVDFDGAVTARVYGFRDAADYYARSSSGPEVGRIRTPTLLLSSTDDPLVPGGSIPPDAAENPWLSVAATAAGGHVGFVAGSALSPRFWAEDQLLRFFSRPSNF